MLSISATQFQFPHCKTLQNICIYNQDIEIPENKHKNSSKTIKKLTCTIKSVSFAPTDGMYLCIACL